jgi:hypothetical protein
MGSVRHALGGLVKIRNINPLGRVDVPILRREGDVDGEGRGCLEAGEVVEVPDDVAAALLEQTANFEAVADEPRAHKEAAK